MTLRRTFARRYLEAWAACGVLIVVGLVWATLRAHAEAPAGTVPGPLKDWYQSLRAPDTGWSCCSQTSDCRTREYRITDGHYEIFVDNRGWLVVPPEKVLERTDNPEGKPVSCWDEVHGVMCFVRAAGG